MDGLQTGAGDSASAATTKEDPKPVAQNTDTEGFWKKEAEKHQRELKKIQDAQKSDYEKKHAEAESNAKRADAAEARMKQALISAAFESAAAKAGAKNAQTARAIADLSSFTIDDNDRVVGDIDKVITKLKKEHDYLFAAPNAGSGGAAVTMGAGGAARQAPGKDINSAVDEFLRASIHRQN